MPLPILSKSLESVVKWTRIQRQRLVHKSTLAEYKKGAFDYSLATISVGDALENKLLDPQCLQSDMLIQIAPKLDARVWNAWNESSAHRLDAYMSFYDVDEVHLKTQFPSMYNTLLPFEKVIQIAIEQKSLVLLKWLHALENPWRKFEWRPVPLLGRDYNVGEWALNTFPKLELDPSESERLAKYFLWDKTCVPTRDSEITQIHKDAFNASGWSATRNEQEKIRVYAQRVLDILLPPAQWNWRQRWDAIGKEISYASSLTSKRKGKVKLSACRGAMIAALLHDAPLDTQMILCAFKCCRHPDEPNEGHPDAQFIRHQFFGEKPPVEPPSALISTTFLFIDTIDSEVAAGFVLEQLALRDNPSIETFSLAGLDIAP